MKIIQCQQGTEEWIKARIGTPSASNFDNTITTKGEPSKQRTKYMYRLAGEFVSGRAEETFQSLAMAKGVETEAEARSVYEMATGEKVEQVGFCLHDTINAGCSPDGLVGKNGGLELKCPLVATHVSYLLDGKLPTEYFTQVQGSLFITGLKWWDFMSYSAGLKPFITRVKPDATFHAALEVELRLFTRELQEIINKIK